ncbi:unnamed protein product [Cuscuta campestris]|uniref:ABC1 atypical kinase-like domain-containing protein n=1 Tax=Cuscuta campestris TaxID=132261 RepID=A0A484L0B3_9ASTE|nr:unnamed protein product [Cuscuta campestris]
MFEEIDYILEAHNAERFASLYASYYSENISRGIEDDSVINMKVNGIKVPKIYWNFTRKEVLTMEWIDGIKLTDESRLRNAHLNKKKLVDQGLYCSLRQLLEVGFFHADPHPGNLVATEEGSLAYFDFGMMGDIPRHYRVGLIRILVHFVNRDSMSLANDFLSLGFIPEEVDIQSVADALRTSFGDGSRQSQDFQGIMNQLYDVMYEFNFSLPPDYALVIRALGSLEGTAKALDPGFKVVESAYPFVIGRLLADPSPDMRRILRELIICNDGSLRWNRLEKLVTAISQQIAAADGEAQHNDSNPLELSFDMRAVVSATEDLFTFILSEKGSRVRAFLIRDIINAADAFLQDEIIHDLFSEKPQSRNRLKSEGQAMVMRVAKGFQSMGQAVRLAPEVWVALFVRLALRSEFQVFVLDIVSALVDHANERVPTGFWIFISRLIHKCNGKL